MKLNLANIVGIPPEAAGTELTATVVGNSSVYLENYGRLLLYTDKEICTKTKNILLRIQGKNLNVETIDKNCVYITGQFLYISYEN